MDHDLSRVERFNHQVKPELDLETAFNGWDEVRVAIMYHPDLVVFNFGISFMIGLEAIRLIRSEESFRELPFLGFTIPHDLFLEEASLNEGLCE